LNANRAEDCAGRCVSRSQSYMLMLAGGGSINYRFCGFFIRLFSVSWVEFGGFWGLTRSFWAKVGFVVAMLLIAKGHNEREGRRGGKQIPSALLREGSSTPGCAPPLRMTILLLLEVAFVRQNSVLRCFLSACFCQGPGGADLGRVPSLIFHTSNSNSSPRRSTLLRSPRGSRASRPAWRRQSTGSTPASIPALWPRKLRPQPHSF